MLDASEILRDVPADDAFGELAPGERLAVATALIARLLDSIEARSHPLDAWESELLAAAISALAVRAHKASIHYCRMVLAKRGRHRHPLKRDLPFMSLKELREAFRLASPDWPHRA